MSGRHHDHHGGHGHGISVGGAFSRILTAAVQLAGLAFVVDVLSNIAGGR